MTPDIDPPEYELETSIGEEWYDKYSEEPCGTCPHCLTVGVVEVDPEEPVASCKECGEVWDDTTEGWDLAEAEGKDKYIKARMSEFNVESAMAKQIRRKEASEPIF